jgi:ferredoxin
LSPPFSCQAGNCATCIARICEGSAVMKVNDALDDDEVADGWVLTCQAVQQSDRTVVVYGATP